MKRDEPKDKQMSTKKTAKAKAKVRTKTLKHVIDIDLSNRDNIRDSVLLNAKPKLTEKDAMLIASVLIEVKQLLVKNWREIRDIRDEHFGGKLKLVLPVVLDCTEEPEIVKVKLSIPRPAHKDAAETTTDDPEQLTIDTVTDTVQVRTTNGVVVTEGDTERAATA